MAATRNKASAELSASLAAWLDARLPGDAVLWVGLSGGRDSVVLLHLCHSILLPERLRAIHVHHGLSPHGDAWADFCVRLCQGLEIPLTTERVHVVPAGQGLEAAARAARYRAYAQTGASYLALAHHRRDQAETLLFNLCRGAGVDGGAAMPAQRREGLLNILRPLLGTASGSIAAYAAEHGLTWVEDESNRDEGFSRNFLRHRVLPLLESRFPGTETTLARAAGNFAEAAGLLTELAALDDRHVAVQVARLADLSPPRRSNWLRYRIHQRGWVQPEQARLQEALRQLMEAPKGACFVLSLPEGQLGLWRGQLFFLSPGPPLPTGSLLWQGQEVLSWGRGQLRLAPVVGAGLNRAQLASGPLSLRRREGGEILCPGDGRPRRALKKLLQEAALPPWERDALPLVYVGETLVACPGVAVAAGWQCPSGEPGLQLSWCGGLTTSK